MANDVLKLIQNKIIEKGQSWTAGTTPLSGLSQEEKKKYLGLVIPEDEMKMIREMASREEAFIARQGRAFVYASSWDWRSVNSTNWTTPIRNQSGCGACVAFATVATVEANLKLFRRTPATDPNLSEADLFFRGCGACCQSGWNFAPALNYARNSGIPDEACWPYNSDQNQSCANRDQRIVKIESWKTLSGAAQAKEWLNLKGPIMSGLHVYDDFYWYTGGIYQNASGGYLGNHAVCIVGYNDAGGYWICKNSWSTQWGDDGWFKIKYGECGMGTSFAFYAVQFTTDDDLIMPKAGRVIARLKEVNTALADEICLSYPGEKTIFKAEASQIGKSFEIGTFSSGSRLTLALKASDGNTTNTYYTNQSLNADACDHVKKVQTGTYKWELRWEDLLGLGEQDYNDVVMEIEVFSPTTEDITLTKDGRVFVTLKSMIASSFTQFGLASPQELTVFRSGDAAGKTVDLGAYSSGQKLRFCLEAANGYTYYTDQVINPDSLSHVRKLPTAYNRWELRWEEAFGLKNKDYKDLIVTVESLPISIDDIVLTRKAQVVARFVSKNTLKTNQFWIYQPNGHKIFDATKENLRKSFDLGEYEAGTRLIFSILTDDGYTYCTNSNLNPDSRVHVTKLPLGTSKYLLRWEDQFGLKDRDYNDLVVEISLIPK